MRRIAGPLLAALFVASSFAPAFAQSTANLPVKTGSGSTVTIAGQNDASSNFHYRDVMEGLDVSGNPRPILTDSSGNQYTNIIGTLPGFASTPTFNCGTGCYQATQPISGSVSVATLPALAAGGNTIGSIANISGTVSLPTGASTAALQTTGNA